MAACDVFNVPVSHTFDMLMHSLDSISDESTVPDTFEVANEMTKKECTGVISIIVK